MRDEGEAQRPQLARRAGPVAPGRAAGQHADGEAVHEQRAAAVDVPVAAFEVLKKPSILVDKPAQQMRAIRI